MSKIVNWELTVPIEKSNRDGEGWFIKGVASGPGIDAERYEGQPWKMDRITPQAIERFANQLSSSTIPFMNFHKRNDIGEELGEVVKAWIEESGELGVEIELDQDNPYSQMLWKKLDKGKQFGLSIHGDIADCSYESDPDTGHRVRALHDVKLDEISITTRPSYTKSFGTVVRKSLDDAEQEESTLSEENVVQAEEVVETAPEVTKTEAPAPEAIVEETVEKSVTTDTAKDAKKLAALVKNHRENERILTELGLLSETENTDSSTVTDTTAEKSATVDTSEQDILVKSLNETIAGFKAELEAIKERIPGTEVPAVMVAKSSADEFQQMYKQLDVRDRMKIALALQQEGK